MAQITTEHSRRLLAKYGYVSGLVERYIPQIKRRTDYCGFGDIIAYKVVNGDDISPNLLEWWAGSEETGEPTEFKGCLCVQSCAGSRLADHLDKVITDPVSEKLQAWLQASNRFEIWGWSHKGARGKQKIYYPSIRRLVFEDEFYVYENTELEAFGYMKPG